MTGSFDLEFEDTFDGDVLDPTRWIPYYLPHWSSREQAAARYEVGGGRLRLLITTDQEPWCPELDGDVRASSLQTGLFAGPVGSSVGQHRFHPDAVVREAQANARLYTPQYGRFVVRARALDDPSVMVALWMIGYEDVPEHSAEICACEIFGRDVRPNKVKVGMGVHPFGDPQDRRRLLCEDAPDRRAPASRVRRRVDAGRRRVLRRRRAREDGAPVAGLPDAADAQHLRVRRGWRAARGGLPEGVRRRLHPRLPTRLTARTAVLNCGR